MEDYLVSALNRMKRPDETHEGAYAYEFSMDHALEFFSKAGSLFSKRDSYYGYEDSALSLFQKSWVVDKTLTMRLLLWLRDCRGGSGNRSGARECLKWLGNKHPEWIKANIGWIPLVGRWDDLRALFGTKSEEIAVGLWAEALKSGDVLAAKWADRSDSPLRKALGMKIGDFRKMLAQMRKDHIVEHKMCHNEWEGINYENVPSVAMARYTKAFGRHDEDRFQAYKDALVKGEAKIHADVLFPHDCVRTSRSGDRAIADAQFEALPNYMEGSGEKIIVISDTSGSMSIEVAGSIRAVDISQGLALYCSAKIEPDNPFYKKFIGFCSESKFKDWNGMKFSEAVNSRRIFDGAIGSTRIDKALMLILKTATFFNLTQEQLPTMLLIVSDMQFHSGAKGDGTEVEKCFEEFRKAGYEPPKVVYWNTAGYQGSQATMFHKNVGMVSGFSPAILKAIFGGEDFSPIGIMLKALEKYQVDVP